jgi:hypothetical protein
VRRKLNPDRREADPVQIGSNIIESRAPMALKASALLNKRLAAREMSPRACLARHWAVLEPTERIEAIRRAELIGRTAGRLAFLVRGNGQKASPRDYYEMVVRPLFLTGTMSTAWHDRWRNECYVLVAKPVGRGDRPSDPRVDAFIREWAAEQHDGTNDATSRR